MARSLSKLMAWKLAEQDVLLARNRWRAALGFSLDDQAAAHGLKAELASKREAAHALFLEAMEESEEIAQALHHQNFQVKRS